jgi:Ca2+-binding EF-hand superfamily protein
MMRKPIVLAMLAGAVGLAGLVPSVSAEEHKARKRFWFRPKKDAEVVVVNTLAFVDQNDDGEVTEVEFFQHVKTHSFRRLDADEDGKVSKAEWLAVEAGPDAEALFDRWDKNGDGGLTLKEFKDTPRAKTTVLNLFKTLDTDGDGTLSAAEFDIKEE